MVRPLMSSTETSIFRLKGMAYLCAVKNRDVVEVVDLAEEVLSALNCDTFLLGIGGVVECESNLVHFLGTELNRGIGISDV